MHDRRAFLSVALGSALAFLTGEPGRLAGSIPVLARPDHPDPRPGIDGSHVLASDRLSPDLAELFDQIRAIPQVVDGIRCRCGCADVPDMYSLLSCYEEPAMAQYCEICQSEGRMVVRLHAEGRTLDEIRAAIDERYG